MVSYFNILENTHNMLITKEVENPLDRNGNTYLMRITATTSKMAKTTRSAFLEGQTGIIKKFSYKYLRSLIKISNFGHFAREN